MFKTSPPKTSFLPLPPPASPGGSSLGEGGWGAPGGRHPGGGRPPPGRGQKELISNVQTLKPKPIV